MSRVKDAKLRNHSGLFILFTNYSFVSYLMEIMAILSLIMPTINMHRADILVVMS